MKSNKIANLGEDGVLQDKISDLPDVILSHILSFVSTREAVRSSILAKRWNFVWQSVHILNLDEQEIYKPGFTWIDAYRKIRQVSFIDFLDRVILDREMPYIEAITIRNGDANERSRVKDWICAAVDRNVHELCLHHSMYPYQSDVLPQSLFASNKLVVLKLRTPMILNVPASICLPNLKVLELRSIKYKDDESVQTLISGCPVLEDLTINRSHSDNLVILSVNSPVLKNLKVSRLEVYTRRNDEKKLVIDTPALESIDICDSHTKEYEISRDLSFVVKAKLDIPNCLSWTCLHELLYKISSAKSLSLSSVTMEFILSRGYEVLPKLQNLINLEVHGDTVSRWTRDPYRPELKWVLIIQMLYVAPVLENIIIGEFSWDAKHEVCQSDVPKCLKTSLKSIKVMGFSRDHNLENLTYFLENARVLEKFTINYGYRPTKAFKVKVPKMLSKIRFYFC